MISRKPPDEADLIAKVFVAIVLGVPPVIVTLGLIFWMIFCA